jgi:hypothetical protein
LRIETTSRKMNTPVLLMIPWSPWPVGRPTPVGSLSREKRGIGRWTGGMPLRGGFDHPSLLFQRSLLYDIRCFSHLRPMDDRRPMERSRKRRKPGDEKRGRANTPAKRTKRPGRRPSRILTWAPDPGIFSPCRVLWIRIDERPNDGGPSAGV